MHVNKLNRHQKKSIIEAEKTETLAEQLAKVIGILYTGLSTPQETKLIEQCQLALDTKFKKIPPKFLEIVIPELLEIESKEILLSKNWTIHLENLINARLFFGVEKQIQLIKNGSKSENINKYFVEMYGD